MATGRVPTTANSPLTAKGDLFGYSTTQARVAVGNDGETLVADSSTSTGLRYQSAYNGNAIINGGMDIAQRGSSINTAATTFAYTLDRLWVYSNGPAVTTSQQATGDTTNLPNIQYCARLQRQSGQTSTISTVWNMPLETKDAIRFVGQTVTVSYYARKSSTYTAGLNLYLYSGTGTDQSGLGGYTGQATVINNSTTLTTTWQRFQATASVGATATELRIELNTGSWTGTAGASDYVEVTGIQLELGSVATSFKRAGGGTIQGELAACQRYYFQDAAAVLNAQQAVAATTVYGVYYLPVAMRANPTLTQTGSSIASSNTSATTFTYDASAASPNKVGFYVTGGASTGQVYLYRPIQVSAEL